MLIDLIERHKHFVEQTVDASTEDRGYFGVAGIDFAVK
jgi:hypothetical protein